MTVTTGKAEREEIPVVDGTPAERDPYDYALPGLYLPSHRDGDAFTRYGFMAAMGRGMPMFYFYGFGEMAPRFDNRVTVHRSRRDRWGVPVPVVDCSHSREDEKTVRDMLRDVEQMAEATGLSIDREEPRLRSRFTSWLARRLSPNVAPGGLHPGASIHETGGACMGSSPETSVVGPENQCWEAPNVIVADGASFVSSGYQNITLTLMAVTSRACEHLARELERT